jgi:hypothetical protein
MFTIQYVKNLKWINEEHTIFDCIVKYVEFDEEHPSGIHANDPYAHINEIWTKGIAGEYGSIAEYINLYPTPIPVVDVSPNP